jgi:predicted ATP-grasp superfamily ATP-dependent carboligase
MVQISKKHFIIKNKYSHHGQGNEIIEDNLYSLIKKYDEKYQIQDFLYTKCVDAVNLSCLEGKILGAYSYKTFYPSHVVKETNFIENTYIKDFLKAIVKNLNYNGFIEIEFLIDHSGTIYIIECNPRMSGCANSYYYFKSVTLPYVNALNNKKIIEIDLYEKKNFFET